MSKIKSLGGILQLAAAANLAGGAFSSFSKGVARTSFKSELNKKDWKMRKKKNKQARLSRRINRK